MTGNKRVNSKEKIVEAAIHLFSQKSLKAVSVRDIAKEAGVSPALIYKYYDNQQDLHIAALKIEARKLINELQAACDLSELVESYLRHMYKKDMLYHMMVYTMLEMKSTPQLEPPLEETSEIIQLFERALPAYLTSQRKQQAQLLFSALNGLLITYKNYPAYSEEQAFSHILSLAKMYLTLLKQ